MGRHKTPLRYPGGKQKLAPFVAEVLAANALIGGDYVEPYAGGAGVAMELLLGGFVSRVHLNDAAPEIYAFWRSILTQTESFCRRIQSASLTMDEWRRQRQILKRSYRHNQLEVGFSLFYLNRCNRSGIPSGGPIGGVDQTGEWKLDARFSRNELITRIEAIAAKASQIKVRNMDAEDYLRDYVARLPEKTLVYCDPPYFQKAHRLYLNHYDPQDHKRIAQIIQKHLRHRWLVSYDTSPEIMSHYAKRRSFTYGLQYNAADVREGREVFFFSDGLRLPSSSKVERLNAGLGALAIV